MTAWTLTGSGALELFGDTHTPTGEAKVCVVLLHGYMGYKDYGFLPVLAERVAGLGAVVHRFNFAYSGMTNNIVSFERADLFAQQTWNSQVFDTLRVLDAVGGGRLDGKGLPLVLVGHSRGGATALLTAGRHAGRGDIDAVVTLAAPDSCCSMSAEAQRAWLESGFLDVKSNRTGQAMTILSRWLEDQIADPAGHDLPARTADIRVPVVAVHGSEDPSVAVECAARIAAAARDGRSVLIPGTNHVFDMPNPPVAGGSESAGLVGVVNAIASLLGQVTDNNIGS